MSLALEFEIVSNLCLQIQYVLEEVPITFITCDTPFVLVLSKIIEKQEIYGVLYKWPKVLLHAAWMPLSPRYLAFFSEAKLDQPYKVISDSSEVKNINYDFTYVAQNFLIVDSIQTYQSVQSFWEGLNSD